MDINLLFSDNSNITHHLLRRERGEGFQRNQHGFAASIFRERMRFAKNLFKTDLKAHFGCVNAIEFSHGNGKYLASGGDDKRVLIWDLEKAMAGIGEPRILQTEHNSNIFCLDFDCKNHKILSGGNDDQVIAHDFNTGQLVNVFRHEHPVYGVSIDPTNMDIFATACEDGKILIYDQREGTTDPTVMTNLGAPFHAVQYHPAGKYFLVTANSKTGAAFWDIRKSKQPLIQFGNPDQPLSCMSVRFNSNGSLILALRRRLPPILYNTKSATPVCTFYHPKYYNSCTMKSCSFAGENDEFVLSGSDDFNLYVWSLADVNLEQKEQWVETTQMVLYGHRSIVNQVRYNKNKCLIASSGVEKLVKLWSPFSQKGWTGSLLEEATGADNPRTLFSPTSLGFFANARNGWGHMTHDYSARNTAEDPRMMAFFDTLIQQEIEGWETQSSLSSSDVDDEEEEQDEDEAEEDEDDNGNVAEETEEDNISNSHTDSTVENDESDYVDEGNGNASDIEEDILDDLAANEVQQQQYDVLNALEDALPAPTVRARSNYHCYNRIAYLIAKKRSHLRRLAMRGACANNLNNVRRVPGPRLSARVPIKRSLLLAHNRAANELRRSRATLANLRRDANRPALFDTFEAETSSDESAGEDVNATNVTEETSTAVPSTSQGITSGERKAVVWNRYRQFANTDDSVDGDDNDIDNQPSTSTAAAHRSKQTALATRTDLQASIDREISAMNDSDLPQIAKKYNTNVNTTRGRIVCVDPNASISNWLSKRRVLPNGCNNNDYWSDSSDADNTVSEDMAVGVGSSGDNTNNMKNGNCRTKSTAHNDDANEVDDEERPTVSKRRKLSLKEYMEERLENGSNALAASTDNHESSHIEHYEMLKQMASDSVPNIANGEQTPFKVVEQNGNQPEKPQQQHVNNNGNINVNGNANANGSIAAKTETVYWYTPDSGISMASMNTPLQHNSETTGHTNATIPVKKTYVRRIYPQGDDETDSD